MSKSACFCCFSQCQMRFSQGIRQNLPVLEYEEAISAYLAWTAEQGSVGILPAARWASKRHSGV
jgi:hypothetical protein